MAEMPPALAAKIAGNRVVRVNGQILVACPSHADGTPSLAIKLTAEGSALLTCHAGCDTRDVLAAWGLGFSDIMPPRAKEEMTGEWTPVKDQYGNNLPATAIYRYEDEKNTLLYEVVRVNLFNGKKEFRQRRPDHTKKTGWTWSIEGIRRVLYRLPKVIAAVSSGEEVVITEGEKDVHTAESLGYVATCNSGGAGKFLPEFADVFKDGAHALIVADADEAGRKHARAVKAMIEAVGGIVRVAESLLGKDLTDHVAAGGTMADLKIVDETELPDLGMIDLVDLVSGEDEDYDWLVPGLLERGERCVITGPEGLGKSSLLRQIAICIAAGIHPFQHSAIQAKRVVWLDAENSKRQNRRAFSILFEIARTVGKPISRDQFLMFLRPEGLDLSRENDRNWFNERLAITKPDLVVLGPWYRTFVGNPSEEDLTRRVVATIDAARARYGFTILMEAHSPHNSEVIRGKMGGTRAVRPIGSSLLLRWPEFGYGLSFRDPSDSHVPEPGDTPIPPGSPDPNYADFLAWRGARDEREWPVALRRSNDPNYWPWLPSERRDMEGKPMAGPMWQTSKAFETVRGAIKRTEKYERTDPSPEATGVRDYTEPKTGNAWDV